MKRSTYINNRLRMNQMVKNTKSKTPSKIPIKNKQKNENNSSRRYLDLFQNEKSTPKNLLTPDINKKSIKKKSIYEPKNNTLETEFLNFLKEDEKEINNNINLLSNSFDMSRSIINIEEYMNLYYYSKNKNPFLNKANDNIENENNKKYEKEKYIVKYSYKNKNWALIEKFDENDKTINIYWKEILDENINKDKNKEFKDLNILEENYNSMKLEYNKIKQIYNDLTKKYENISKKIKEYQIQLNYNLLKLKEAEKEKEKYIKKNLKLKEEIHKIPALIEEEMIKFREEAQKNISKKIHQLEQENKILKGERYLLNNSNEINIIDSSYINKINNNDENPSLRKQ